MGITGSSAWAQGVSLTLASGSGAPGSTVDLNINLTASSTAPASLQWSIGYSTSILSSLTVTEGASATNAGKTITCNGSGTMTCILFGLNTTTIANGVVGVVHATISPSTSSTSTAISLSGGVASDPNGSGITPVTATGATLSITQSQPTLSITVTTSPAGLGVVVDTTSYPSSPQTFQWTSGSSHTIGVSSPQGSGTRYTYASWSDSGAQSHAVAPTVATTYTATFQTAHLLTTAISPSGAGSIQASPSSPDGYYAAGTTVQLTASATQGFQFSSWSGSATGSANPTSVVMSTPRNVTANYTSTPAITVSTNPAGLGVVVDGTSYPSSPQVFQWTSGSSHTIGVNSPQGSGTRYTYASWSDSGAQSHTVAPTVATTYTATFQTAHLLTTAISPSGAGSIQASPSSPDGYYAAGTTVQLTASATQGFQFSSWSGSATGSATPTSVVMSTPRSVTANFSAGSQNIIITTSPAGLGVTVDGTGYSSSPQLFQWTPGSTHTIGVNSPLGSAGTVYTFAGWSDSGPQTHAVTAPSGAATYTATFQTAYLLTKAANPAANGSVQVSPASGDGYYAAGTIVQLTASANSGSQFSSWSGDASGSANPAAVTMNAPRNITANFSSIGVQSFTVTTNPAGFGVVVDGTTYPSSPQIFQWTPGSSHTIGVSLPLGLAGTRYAFINWSDGGAQSHTVSPSVATTYTATLQAQYLLTTAAIPAGSGAVQVLPSSADGYYAGGSVIQLTPAPSSGFQFGAWSGDLTGAANPVTFAMSGPKSVSAGFVAFTGCTYSLSRANFAALSEGDIGRVDLTTGEGCGWAGSSNVFWITITSAAAGAGASPIRFTVAANPGANMRTGTLTIAGQPFTVGQAGAGCASAISVSASGSVPAGGGALNLNISAPEGCEWSSAQAPAWLNLNSGAHGNGAGLAQLSADGNATASPRTGSVSVGGIVSDFVQPSISPAQLFLDVPLNHPYSDYIALLRLFGVTSGCSAIEYCPDLPTSRGQMAVFIIRSLMGGDNFSYSQTPFFTDVASTHPYFKHIQKMRDLGITTGCSATEYCPDAPVTRGQMAVFLIRSKLNISGAQGFPYPAAAFFQDVTSGHDYFAFIQKMKQLGITSGCSAAEFCPDAPTTRGQMAVFLIRAFFTP